MLQEWQLLARRWWERTRLSDFMASTWEPCSAPCHEQPASPHGVWPVVPPSGEENFVADDLDLNMRSSLIRADPYALAVK